MQNAVLGSLLPAGTGAGVTTGQTTGQGSAAGYTGAGSGARRGASTASNPILQSSGSLLPAGQAGTAVGGGSGGISGSATQPGGAYTSGVQQGGYSSGNVGNGEANPIGHANAPPTGHAPAGYDTGSPGIASPGSSGGAGSGGGAYMTGVSTPSPPPGPQAGAPPAGPSWSQGTMDGTLAAGGVLGGGMPVPGVSDGGAAPGSGKIGLQAGLSKAVAAVAMNGVSAGGLFNISALVRSAPASPPPPRVRACCAAPQRQLAIRTMRPRSEAACGDWRSAAVAERAGLAWPRRRMP